MIEGRQLTAARALAGLTVKQLAGHATTTKRIISKIETRGEVRVSETRRHGHVSADLWKRITDALAERGVELTEEGKKYGGGARWVAPANKRRPP